MTRPQRALLLRIAQHPDRTPKEDVATVNAAIQAAMAEIVRLERARTQPVVTAAAILAASDLTAFIEGVRVGAQHTVIEEIRAAVRDERQQTIDEMINGLEALRAILRPPPKEEKEV
jgi:hypothetical protein